MNQVNNSGTCSSCPYEMTNCTEPGIDLTNLPLKPGYWRSSNRSVRVERCFTPASCAGGRVHNEGCTTGHGGPFCEVCDPDFYRDAGRSCSSCSGGFLTSMLVAIAIVLLVLAVIIGACVFRRLKAKRKDLKAAGRAEGSGPPSIQEFIGRLPVQKVMETLKEKFDLSWPELNLSASRRAWLSFSDLSLPPLSLPEFILSYPNMQWPSGSEITLPYLANFLQIAFPDLTWPPMPSLNLPEWDWPELRAITWQLPDVSLPELLEMLKTRFPALSWPLLPEMRLPDLSLPSLSLPQFRQRYHLMQWPSGPELTLPCLVNFLQIAFPDLTWPPMPSLNLPEWNGPVLPSVALSLARPLTMMPSIGCISIDALLVKLRVLISTLQVLSQFGIVYSIPYPPIYTQLLRWLSLVQLDFISVVPLECIFPEYANFFLSLALRTLFLPVLACIPAAVWLRYRAGLLRQANQEAPSSVGWFLGQCGGVGFYLLFLIYPSVSANIFATFQCEGLDDGSYWLRADFSIRCYTRTHYLMMIYAVGMSCVYPLGIPALYYVLLRRHRATLDKLMANQNLRIRVLQEARARRRYVKLRIGARSVEPSRIGKPWHVSCAEWKLLGSQTQAELTKLDAIDAQQQAALPSYVKKLLNGYELRTWWFEIFECFRKLAVACVPVFFVPSGSISQLVFGLMVCFITFGMFVYYAPFEETGDDRLAQLCQGQIFFALLSSIALSFDAEQRTASRNLDVLLVALWVLPITLSAFLLSPLSLALQRTVDGGRASIGKLRLRNNKRGAVTQIVANEPCSDSASSSSSRHRPGSSALVAAPGMDEPSNTSRMDPELAEDLFLTAVDPQELTERRRRRWRKSTTLDKI